MIEGIQITDVILLTLDVDVPVLYSNISHEVLYSNIPHEEWDIRRRIVKDILDFHPNIFLFELLDIILENNYFNKSDQSPPSPTTGAA